MMHHIRCEIYIRVFEHISGELTFPFTQFPLQGMYTDKVHFHSVDEFSEMRPSSLGSGVRRVLLMFPPLLQSMDGDPQIIMYRKVNLQFG